MSDETTVAEALEDTLKVVNESSKTIKNLARYKHQQVTSETPSDMFTGSLFSSSENDAANDSTSQALKSLEELKKEAERIALEYSEQHKLSTGPATPGSVTPGFSKSSVESGRE